MFISGGGGGKKGKGKKGKKGGNKDADQPADEVEAIIDRLEVLHMKSDSPEVVVHENVKNVRPFIVCCIVRNLDLTGPKFKSFIQLQTKLHESVCEKRNAATIATHDLAKIPKGNLDYTAMEPEKLEIVPLMKTEPFKAVNLVQHLRDEAEAYRKVK